MWSLMEFIIKSQSNANFKNITKLLPSGHRDGYQYLIDTTIFYEKSQLLMTNNAADKAQIFGRCFCDIEIIETTQEQINECNIDDNTLSFRSPSTLLDTISQYIKEYDLLFKVTYKLLVINFIAKQFSTMNKNKEPIQIDLFTDDLDLEKTIKQNIPRSFKIGISSFSFEKSAMNMTSSFQLPAAVLCRHFDNASTVPTNSKKTDAAYAIFNTEIVALEHCRVAENESRLILYTNDCRDICISSFKFKPTQLTHHSFFIIIKKIAVKKLTSLLKNIDTIDVSLLSEESNIDNTHCLRLSTGNMSFSVDVELKEKFKDSTTTLKKMISAYRHNEQPYDVNKWHHFSVENELYKSNAHAIEMNYHYFKKEPENNIKIKYIYQEDVSNQASSILNTSIFSVMPFQSNCNLKLNLRLFNHAIKTLSEHESPVKISSNEFDYDGILLSSEVNNTFNERFYFLVPFEA